MIVAGQVQADKTAKKTTTVNTGHREKRGEKKREGNKGREGGDGRVGDWEKRKQSIHNGEKEKQGKREGKEESRMLNSLTL